jgi:hypothetical protein
VQLVQLVVLDLLDYLVVMEQLGLLDLLVPSDLRVLGVEISARLALQVQLDPRVILGQWVILEVREKSAQAEK